MSFPSGNPLCKHLYNNDDNNDDIDDEGATPPLAGHTVSRQAVPATGPRGQDGTGNFNRSFSEIDVKSCS